MTVQEVFNSTAVRSIEVQILSLYHETERKHWYIDENKKTIKREIHPDTKAHYP